jgi:T4 bacteriophage base plate protein
METIMALPKIKVPLFDVTIPSQKKDAKYRPFLVKEEKILLMAQAGGTRKEMINALKQVINNCVTMLDGSDVDVDNLTTFDLEYIFLKIRSKSVDNVVELKYTDNEDQKSYDFKVSLDNIEIQENPEHNKKIKISDDIGIIMKYPTPAIVNAVEDPDASETDVSIRMIRECIDQIYDKENVFLAKEASKEELDEFVDSMTVKNFEDIQKFFETMPRLYHKIEYKNSKGTARTIELVSLEDFFTLV